LDRDAAGLGAGLGEAFGELPGYCRAVRRRRPLAEAVLTLTGWMGRLPSAASLVRIKRALGDPGRDGPGWLAQLQGKLTETARLHRQLVIRTAVRARPA
jgi:hypothetical protein